MLRNLIAVAFGALLTIASGNAFAQGGTATAAEAKAMMDKAVAALKADKTKALADFNNATGSFRDRDLYVFAPVPQIINLRRM